MKLNEFEARLSSVSEAKLRLMFADCREKGPAVAVDLLRAEAGRRGVNLDTLDTLDSGARVESAASSTFAGETADGEEDGLAPDAGSEAAPAGEGVTPETSEGEPPKGAWLAEETSSGGLPVTVKILLAVAVLGGIGVGVFLAFGKG